MNTKLLISVIGLTCLLVGCGKPSAPTSQQTLDFLNSHLSATSPIEFSSPTLETFPEGDGRCRVKYKVTARLKEDLLTTVSPEEAMKAVGWDALAFQSGLAQVPTIDEPFKSQLLATKPTFGLGDIHLAKVATKAGTEAPVYGTLEAERQADDSWTFSSIEGGKVTQGMTGFSASSQPGHYALADSDEAQKALASEIDREKSFMAAIDAARKQSDDAKTAQNQQKADQHASLVQQVLAATTAGKKYLGTLTSAKGNTQIILVFDSQANGGRSVSAHFENPADPTQIRSLKGALVLENDEYPVRLRGEGTHILSSLPDRLLTQWLGELSFPIKLKLTATGELIGEGYETQMTFKVMDSTTQIPVKPVEPPSPVSQTP